MGRGWPRRLRNRRCTAIPTSRSPRARARPPTRRATTSGHATVRRRSSPRGSSSPTTAAPAGRRRLPPVPPPAPARLAGAEGDSAWLLCQGAHATTEVARTTDGGRRWASVAVPATLAQLQAVSATTAWAMTVRGQAVVTSDGGRRWQRVWYGGPPPAGSLRRSPHRARVRRRFWSQSPAAISEGPPAPRAPPPVGTHGPTLSPTGRPMAASSGRRRSSVCPPDDRSGEHDAGAAIGLGAVGRAVGFGQQRLGAAVAHRDPDRGRQAVGATVDRDRSVE